jgi:superfamily II DNA/RNA helicase
LKVRCPPKGKIDYLIDIFKICSLTQTLIFVNTRNFCELIWKKLKENGCRTYIIFGKMEPEERDKYIEKFRN